MAPSTLQHELGKRSAFAHPEEEAYLNLVRTTSLLAHETDQLFRPHGLSSATYNVLRIVRGHADEAKRCGRRFAGVPCSTIAEQTVTPVPDLTRLLDRLCVDGLVERQRGDDDRRVVLIRLTAKGRSRLARLDGPLAALHRRQLGQLSRRELAELSRLLAKSRNPAPGKT
jgi:DNA-binding MarR family transcriptional regulator